LPIFIATVVLIATLAVLAYPFFVRRANRDGLDDAAVDLAQRLRRARDRVYEEIRALQQEYFLGNTPEDKYRELLQAARMDAASLMQQQQQVQQKLEEINDQIEQELEQATGEQAEDAPGSARNDPTLP
jgi:flagellar basal body-associated protein FliL